MDTYYYVLLVDNYQTLFQIKMIHYITTVIIQKMTDVILLFTDPGCIGDIVCNVHLAQQFKRQLVIVICSEPLFESYMQTIGNKLRDIYGCTFIQEEELVHLQLTTLTNSVYIHSPTEASSAQWIEKNSDHIAAIYRLGGDHSSNFRDSPEMRAVLDTTRRTTLYKTTDTEFILTYDAKVYKQLGGFAKQIYHDYFEFSRHKKIYSFASAYWSTKGYCDPTQLPRAVVDSLKQLERDTTV